MYYRRNGINVRKPDLLFCVLFYEKNCSQNSGVEKNFDRARGSEFPRSGGERGTRINPEYAAKPLLTNWFSRVITV